MCLTEHGSQIHAMLSLRSLTQGLMSLDACFELYSIYVSCRGHLHVFVALHASPDGHPVKHAASGPSSCGGSSMGSQTLQATSPTYLVCPHPWEHRGDLTVLALYSLLACSCCAQPCSCITKPCRQLECIADGSLHFDGGKQCSRLYLKFCSLVPQASFCGSAPSTTSDADTSR